MTDKPTTAADVARDILQRLPRSVTMKTWLKNIPRTERRIQCYADAMSAEKDVEIDLLRKQNLSLFKGFQDCLSYYSPDNLTMQTKERDWRKILTENKREARGL